MVVKPIGERQRNVEIFLRPTNVFCLFTEIYWSVDEVILESVTYIVLVKKSPISIISQYAFTLTVRKITNAKSSSEEHIDRTQKASRGF